MFEEYLEETEYVDFSNIEVRKLADKLKKESTDEIELVQKTYQFVRDDIKHSWDVQDKRVPVSASDVLREGVGICWAKANLLVAFARYIRIRCVETSIKKY